MDLFDTHTYPVKIDVPCLFLCQEGEMEIEVNLQSYTFDKKHLFCFTIPCACRIVKRNRNFRCVRLLFSERSLGELLHATLPFLLLMTNENDLPYFMNCCVCAQMRPKRRMQLAHCCQLSQGCFAKYAISVKNARR